MLSLLGYMFPSTFLLLLFLFSVSFPSIAAQQQQQQCGVSPLAVEKDHGNSSYPWAVAIFGENWECTGTIINRRHILTAAHCVRSPNGQISNANVIKVAVGSPNIKSLDNVKMVKVSKVIPNSEFDYRTRMTGDVAILRLENSLEFGPTIQPICLDNVGATPGEIAVLTGWGLTRDTKCADIGAGPDTQMQGKMRIMDKKHCDVDEGSAPMVPGKDVCAKPYTAYPNHGDSGGPLMVRRAGGVWYQVGITSYSDCPTDPTRQSDIFTSVYHYRPWIMENAKME